MKYINFLNAAQMKNLIIVILLLAAIVISEIYISEDILADTDLINYRIYADDHNSSFLPYKTTFSGNIIWERKSLFLNDFPSPAHLAINGSVLIIWYIDKIDVTNKINGTSIWNKEIMPNTDFDLKYNGFISMNSAGFYEVYGLNQKIEEQYSLPFLSAQTKLYFSEKIKNIIYYVYQNIPTPTNSPDDKISEPEFIFAGFDLKANDFTWEFVKNGFLICAIKTRQNNKLCLASKKNIYLFDIYSNSENQVQTLSFEKILTVSLDHHDNLLVVNESENGKELKCLTQAGKINWVYPLEDAILSGQPPASDPEDNIYLVLGNILECIKDGKLVWSYKLPTYPGKALITVLKDKSVLVSAGAMLLQISGDGNLIKNKLFNYPLTCRPIVDEEGLIYVANQESIFAIK
ncbi:MAG TPA: hypothetical protein PL018_03835 [Ignavibacteriaceae bacterium]|nr:hypothetical protein [Ignavibacteriaceae bacterium]